ncbi:MAG: 30S ribosomal protein S13 [Caldiserica bacterium CG02_land_8_20_14_3_00_36_38]|nr:30S ribosomal protein S13 [Caldisericota bacterium]OIP13089.1 MAG: 30S ribosomal protein S13 [Caldisericum sp. CG2_30_36_11]PIP49359.1 MAG: 30S ribosomal protein S13 [Caldiserica bacterium CG23_combo_of_CG06-09_8_20_14_all_35_60]PIV54858.1 MAG: 30S ribosomal protein S13 [Caldiserica bacterium CG02_land_8_20_14_3_00_36_38]PIW10910.1 MAG: 30S ribosomal protein S13 [Caldiserica bacterium CG17_big_fil_post_rev_8_21_14_2_50_35_7]PIX29142.1 MAG: 30S ribosomal protein S13 [Caldiserica bacterium CG
MARISGVDLPKDKRVDIALTYIYGIGRHNSLDVLKDAKVALKKVKDLSAEEIKSIENVIKSKYVVEGDLRKKVGTDIKKLMEINCYRGVRHKRGLPVRGQRTRTNSRTRKGPKKTVGSKRKSE